MSNKAEQSSFYTNCFVPCDIYPYTHRALLWKHPCKHLPPLSCLLCFHSSHPRIVFSAHPSLVFVTHKLAMETTIQLVLSDFPFTLFSVQEEQLSLARTLSQRTPRGEFQTDHHWFAGVTMAMPMSVGVTCCTIMYLEEPFADSLI